MNTRVINPVIARFLALSFATLACGTAQPPANNPSNSGTGGRGSGGRSGTVGGASTGGTAGTSPGAGGNNAGTGGSDASTADVAAPDTSPATDGGGSTPVSPGDPGQGPQALGKIVYNQDFEKDRSGISLSPVNLPPERVAVVDDPLGKRGKVISVTWKSGDDFRTSPNTQPRSWISNAKEGGYNVKAGTKVSYAWGQMWPDVNMDAFFAQNIGPGPVWELRLRADGTFNILCNKCGGNQEFMKLAPNRWYDFRVDMDWQDGGAIKFFIDGQMMRQATVNGVGGAPCHWDGGIYNTAGGTASNKTRTTFISNLSVGER